LIASFTVLQKESEMIQTIACSTQADVHKKYAIFNYQIKTNRSLSTDRSQFSPLHYNDAKTKSHCKQFLSPANKIKSMKQII